MGEPGHEHRCGCLRGQRARRYRNVRALEARLRWTSLRRLSTLNGMSTSIDNSPLPVPVGFDRLETSEKVAYLRALWKRAGFSADASSLHDDIVDAVAQARLRELADDASVGLGLDEVLDRVRLSRKR